MNAPRSSYRPKLAAFALSLVILSLAPPVARAQNITQGRSTVFSDTNVSVWSPSRGTGTDLKKILIGPDLNVPFTELGGIGELVIPAIDALPLFYIPSISLGKTGARITFDGHVKAGITFKPWYDGGRMDYTYRASVNVTFPRLPVVGQPTTITARFQGTGGDFAASSPNFGGSFGAVGQIEGKADSEAWFLGARLFNGNVFNIRETPAEKALGGLVKFNVPDEVNFLLGELNPTPIGIEVTRPDVETHGTTVAADGSMTASGFGKFLTVETNLLDWMLLLLPPPAAEAISRAASGNYLVPATDYRVGWDFCRSWANLDVGLRSDHTLSPNAAVPPVAKITIYNAKTGAYIAESSTGSATFVMPIDGVKVVPSLTAQLKFKNRLSVATGGSIGTEPMRVWASGTFGSGDRAKAIDFDFSVGKFVWEGDPSSGTKIIEDEFVLPTPAGGWTRELAPIGINAFDGLELPREVYGTYTSADPSRSEATAYVAAYSYDQATGDISRDRKQISIVAEQGRAFFPNRATFTANLVKADGSSTPIEFKGNTANFTTAIQLDLATERLSPGQHTVVLTVNTFNASNQPRSATYYVPLTVYNPRVSVSPALFTRSDLDVRSSTNRVVADNQETAIYLGGATGILPSTQIILDNAIVLENDWSTKLERDLASQMSNGLTIGFFLSPALKAEMAGQAHTLKLSAPPLVRGADGNLLPPFESQAIPIFVVAGRPTVTGLAYNDVAVTRLPLGNSEVSFDLKGTNFSKATKVYFNLPGLDVTDADLIPASFTSATTMRVRMSQSIVSLLQSLDSPSFTLRAETPVVSVPADAGNAATTSGGSSGAVQFGMDYPVPAINRLVLPTSERDPVVRIRGAQTVVRVFGDHFYLPQLRNGNLPTTKFFLRGIAVTTVPGPTNPDGMTVPYFDVTLPATPNNEQFDLEATNPGDKRSVKYRGVTENGRPALTSLGTNLRLRVPAPGSSFQTTGTGGLIYRETRALLGGIEVGFSETSGTTFRLDFPSGEFSRIPGKTTTAILRNPAPGGGDSAPVTVVLEEGDASKITLAKGVLAFDRASNAWKQEITLTYTGTRTLDGNVNLQFRSLPGGIQLLNGNGTDAGFPSKRVQMNGTTPVKFVALFRKTGTNAISYSNVVRIP